MKRQDAAFSTVFLQEHVPAGTSWAPLSAGAVGIPSRRIAIAYHRQCSCRNSVAILQKQEQAERPTSPSKGLNATV
jgi:hypothetical protein